MKRFRISALVILLLAFVLTFAPMALAQEAVAADGVISSIQNFLVGLVAKFPIAAAIYGVLTGAYMIFCAIAAMTKTTKDDEIANNVWLKRFFSLPIKRPVQ